MSIAPVSPSTKNAIHLLFESRIEDVGLLDLGDYSPADVHAVNIDSAAASRVVALRFVLENYICQMAAEALELGPNEVPRLRSEATGILLCLRELYCHFPEVYDADA